MQLTDGIGVTIHCLIQRFEAVFDLAGVVAHKGARLALQAQLLIQRQGIFMGKGDRVFVELFFHGAAFFGRRGDHIDQRGCARNGRADGAHLAPCRIHVAGKHLTGGGEARTDCREGLTHAAAQSAQRRGHLPEGAEYLGQLLRRDTSEFLIQGFEFLAGKGYFLSQLIRRGELVPLFHQPDTFLLHPALFLELLFATIRFPAIERFRIGHLLTGDLNVIIEHLRGVAVFGQRDLFLFGDGEFGDQFLIVFRHPQPLFVVAFDVIQLHRQLIGEAQTPFLECAVDGFINLSRGLLIRLFGQIDEVFEVGRFFLREGCVFAIGLSFGLQHILLLLFDGSQFLLLVQFGLLALFVVAVIQQVDLLLRKLELVILPFPLVGLLQFEPFLLFAKRLFCILVPSSGAGTRRLVYSAQFLFPIRVQFDQRGLQLVHLVDVFQTVCR